ncbi:MAG: DUF4836 family protein [Raineya sp.]|jgi:hypothetical protein|nr:DUF4836 family protein [Raineya sp.]
MQKTYKPFGNLWYVAFLGTLSLLVSACGGSKNAPEHTKLIPKDAAIVARLDVKQLTGKTISLDKLVSKENLKEMGASDKEAEKASQNIKKFLDSGIDFLNKVYIYSNDVDMKRGTSIGVVFAIDNEDKLTKFIKDDATWKDLKDAKKPEFKEEGKIKFAIFEKNAVMAWQGKIGVLVAKDGVTTADAKKLFEMKGEETLIGSNESFKDAAGKGYDASVWMNIEKLSASSAQASMALGMAGLSNQGTTMNLGFTFEKGKIVVDADYTGNEELNKLSDKITNDNVKSGVLKNIPIENADAGISFSLNLEGLATVLKEKGFLSAVEDNIKEAGITVDDVTKALSGDFVAVVGKVNFDSKGRDIPEFVVSIGVKDKKAFEKVVDALNSKQARGALTKKDNVYEAPGGMGFLVIKDDAAYVTMTASIKEGINKGDSKLKGDFKEKAGKFASVMYVGKGISDSWVASKEYQNSGFGKVYGKNFPFEGGIMKANKMKNKKSQTEVEVWMTDKNQNSLLVLIDMAKKAEKVREEERKSWEKYEKDFDMDKPSVEDEQPVLEEK